MSLAPLLEISPFLLAFALVENGIKGFMWRKLRKEQLVDFIAIL